MKMLNNLTEQVKTEKKRQHYEKPIFSQITLVADTVLGNPYLPADPSCNETPPP